MFFEDIEIGQTYVSQAMTVSQDEIIAFASQFDPQVQHVDPEGARHSIFGELVASGWHTASLTMRLQTDIFMGQFPGGALGAQLDSLAWPRPVRPGDTLYVRLEILAARASRSRADRGVLQVRTTTLNQRDEPVQEMVAALIVPRRPDQASPL